ncbi:MAG: hypothetical protein LBS64_03340, partial [Spirochaetaceae bacterium]|nr:hypothetical protein [Spirochaetaceae bacterium]
MQMHSTSENPTGVFRCALMPRRWLRWTFLAVIFAGTLAAVPAQGTPPAAAPPVVSPQTATPQVVSPFPQGSPVPQTGMPPVTFGMGIPTVDIQIRQPQTGREVAFSLQLLLLLTILTLAPSILILV